MMRRLIQMGATSVVPTNSIAAVQSAQASLSVLVAGLAFDMTHNGFLLIHVNITELLPTPMGRGVSTEVHPLGQAVPIGLLLRTRSLLEDAQKTAALQKK
jgi:hypothetical protein